MNKLPFLAVGAWLCACAADVSTMAPAPEGEAGSGAVAVARAELGSTDTVAAICGRPCGPIAMIGDVAAAVVDPATPSLLQLIHVEEGTVTNVNQGAAMLHVVNGVDGGVYYGTRAPSSSTYGTIRRWNILSDPTVVGLTWGTVDGFAADASWAYWVDDNGLSRRRADGGCCNQVLVGRADVEAILGNDASGVYYYRTLSSGRHQIRRLPAGGGSTKLMADSADEPTGFSQNDTYLHWVDNANSLYDLKRTHKIDRTTSILRSVGNTMRYTATAPNHDVYWAERKSDGLWDIMKRSWAGNVTTEKANAYNVAHLRVHDGYLYWTERASSLAFTYLKRAPL